MVICGISLKITIPEIVAKTRLKYLMGVTVDTAPLRSDMVRKILPVDQAIPISTSGSIYFGSGIVASKNNETKQTTIKTIVKYIAIK